MTPAPTLSVVIPTFQRRDSLLRLLTSLTRQTLPAGAYEVIAVVDGSTDGTAEAARGLAVPYAMSVLEGPNRGRARACNAGVRAATGDVVVFLDDDMEASPDFLAAHARAHAGAIRRAVVGAAPIAISPDSPPFVRYMAKGFRKRLERLGAPGYRLHFRDTYTGNFSAPREVLLAVGGFDEAFRVYGHEDYELALGLQGAGVELVYSASACAHQHYEKTFAGIRAGRHRPRPDGGIVRRQASRARRPDEVRGVPRGDLASGEQRAGLLLGLGRVTDRVPGWIVPADQSRVERREPRALRAVLHDGDRLLVLVWGFRRAAGTGSRVERCIRSRSPCIRLHEGSAIDDRAGRGTQPPTRGAGSWAGSRSAHRSGSRAAVAAGGDHRVAAGRAARSARAVLTGRDLGLRPPLQGAPVGGCRHAAWWDTSGIRRNYRPRRRGRANAASLLHFRRYLLAQCARTAARD